jgi:predicted Fe-Mo cluster-binding NifX family protein
VKIAVTSQNFRTVTGHAGKSRRFIIFDASMPGEPIEIGRLDLPKEMAFHEFSGGRHPLDEMNVLISASAGQGFVRKLALRGVHVVTCGESDPRVAVSDYLSGVMKPALPHDHGEHRHDDPGLSG